MLEKFRRKKLISILKRTLAFTFGLFFCFLLLELSLFIGYRIALNPHTPAPDGSAFTILCLGNSYTAGVGAPQGSSYCDFLGRKLNLLDPPQGFSRYQTVNLGQRSFNSHQVKKLLSHSIEIYHPQIALVMTGETNEWNYEGLDGFVAKNRNTHGIFGLTQAWWWSTASAKFFSLLFTQDLFFRKESYSKRLPIEWLGQFYPDANPQIVRLLSDKEWTEAIDSLELLTRQQRAMPSAALTLARLHLIKNLDRSKAVEWYSKAVEMNGGFEASVWADLRNNHYSIEQKEIDPLLHTIRNKTPKALLRLAEDSSDHFKRKKLFPNGITNERDLDLYRKALKLRPGDAVSASQIIQWLKSKGRVLEAMDELQVLLENNPLSDPPIFTMFMMNFRKDLAYFPVAAQARYHQIERTFLGAFPERSHLIQGIRSDQFEEWLNNDLEEILSITRSRNVDLVLQNYPPKRNPAYYRKADVLISKFANSFAVPFSNTQANFAQLFERTGERELFYSNEYGKMDDHLNARGYEELANGLFKDLMEQGLLR